MGKIQKIIKYILDSDYRFLIDSKRGKYDHLSDEEYLKRKYRAAVKKELDLNNPQTFNEKLQWLKLYDRRPEYTPLVDKFAVKQIVAGKIGEEHIIPTLGVWDNFDEIDFDTLPDQFVLKCTHDSGGLVICRDKSKLNIHKARKKISKSLERDFYLRGREWPYKNVPRKIIAEKYMEDKNASELTDYKFYCFNGEPRFLYISKGLENHATAAISFLTLDWQFAPYERSDYKPFSELPPKPQKFDLMVEIARKLSTGTDFLRVDLYEINGEVYFSELTFSPGSGFTKFKNFEHDLEIGNMLVLTSKGDVRS